ncbi:MAG: metallophosphoesterase [Bacteroidales bacterium]|nr:metallophosphoesterase [Bacteroidales bacterium]MCF8388708.1 metallophosphoesterase [Bacteroidales bacterium]MCF8399501.1 metallophosphoesterase [Bacteroidales bacterium]
MKKILQVILFLVVIVLGFFAVKTAFPKDVSRYPFFVVLLLLDVYLWNSVKKKILRQGKFIRILATFLYWLPLVLILVLFIVSAIKPVMFWDAGIRTYMFGIVFITYASKLFAVLFLFLADIIRLLGYVYRYATQKKKRTPEYEGAKITRSKFLVNMGLISGGVVFSGFLAGMLKWVYDFKLRYVDLRLSKLPDRFNGLKIIQISDLHLGSWASADPLKNVVNIINDENPDLVFFTGDLVNFATREAFDFESTLKDIHAKYGVYAILGNHDYGDYVNWSSAAEKQENLEEMYSLYRRLGWKLLLNENDILDIDGQKLAIIGVENWGAHERFPKYGDLEKAIYGTGDIPLKILLSHDPSHWENVIRRKYPEIALTLSGHTHGFQFGIETSNFKWSPAQYMYKQWAGLYQNNDQEQYVYVNRGTGFIGYPGRIGILPEITEITLKS